MKTSHHAQTLAACLLPYLVFSLSLFVALEIFNCQLPIEGINYLSTHLRRLVDAMIMAIPFIWIRRRWLACLYSVIPVAYILSNVWYLRGYGSIMPLSSYLMVDNLNGLGPSIIALMRWSDLLILLPTTISCVFLCAYNAIRTASFKQACVLTVVALCVMLSVVVPSYLFHDKTEYAHPFGLYRNEVLRAYRQLGFINYWIYEISYLRGVTSEELWTLQNFMDEYERRNADVTNITENNSQNLILILCESLQSWPIGIVVDGVAVTPRLNEIVRREETLYWPNVLPQTSGGRSSDAQLMLNTGLLPINAGAAASLYGTNEYPSLAKALRPLGYTSCNCLCDEGAYWNQTATTKSYGFDVLKDRLCSGEGYSHADEELFRRGFGYLKSQSEPFYAQLVTMSGHDAVETDHPSELRGKEFACKQVEYNLIITQYVDSCIGAFVDELQQSGLYERSVIVITGDHQSITRNLYENRSHAKLEDMFVPFIIINSPLAADTNKVIGESDIYPSLLDIMGVADYSFRGLGTSVFRNHPGGAVVSSGAYTGRQGVDVESLKRMWVFSDLLIRANYFGTKRLTNIRERSDK